MGVIATAVKHLIAAGMTGEDLVRAIEEMESQQENAGGEPMLNKRQERNKRYYQRLKASEKHLNKTIKTNSDGGALPPSPSPLDPPPPDPSPYNPPILIHHPGNKTREPPFDGMGSAGEVGTLGSRPGLFRSHCQARVRQVPGFLVLEVREGRHQGRLGGNLAQLDAQQRGQAPHHWATSFQAEIRIHAAPGRCAARTRPSKRNLPR